jgi:DNA-binding CsgD family transcriptional regulator
VIVFVALTATLVPIESNFGSLVGPNTDYDRFLVRRLPRHRHGRDGVRLLVAFAHPEARNAALERLRAVPKTTPCDHDGPVTPSTLDLVEDLVGAASGSAADPVRAEQVIEVLSATEPGAVGAVAVVDPDGRVRTSADSGYPAPMIEHLTSAAFLVADPGYQLLVGRGVRRARSWRDIPGYRASASAREVFLPWGFAGGVTARLCTADGRHVGDVHLSVPSSRHPRVSTVRALALAAPVLAAVLDPLADAAAAVRTLVPAGLPCALVTHTGVVPVPGRGPDLPVRDHEALVRGLRGRALGPAGRLVFCWTEGGRPRRLAAVGTAEGVLVHPLAMEREPILTPREVQVLSEVATGSSNRLTARRLGLGERTVAHHLERIYEKLGVHTRAQAARAAIEQGWVLLAPPPRGPSA